MLGGLPCLEAVNVAYMLNHGELMKPIFFLERKYKSTSHESSAAVWNSKFSLELKIQLAVP